MATVFFSYSHKDEALRDQLEAHLALLKNQGLVTSWHDRSITPGKDFGETIDSALESADVILLLVSADFLASRYCYSIEMHRAMERHHAKEATVIPVILRDCDWHGAPFGKLQAVPKDARPVTLWPDLDQAFSDVARQVRRLIEQHGGVTIAEARPAQTTKERTATQSAADSPRSSNLRLTKEFSEQHRDDFLREGFEFIARFFSGSVGALGERTQGIEGRLDRIDTRCFAVTLYRNGKLESQCSVRIDGFGRQDGIAYSSDASTRSGSFNELLTVQANAQTMYFKPMGFGMGSHDDQQLTPEGAAEHLWGMFIEPLQHERHNQWR